MMKTYLKNEKGITMTVLIVTIIVTITLAVVSLQAIIPEEGEILEQTEEVKENSELKQIIYLIHNALDYNYYLNSGRELTEASETVEELAEIIKETEILANKFVIYYDKLEDKDFIFYRADLVTDEEKSKINGREYRIDDNNEKISIFMGDANLDGVLSKEDINIMKEEINKKEFYGDRLLICDINKSGEIDEDDINEIKDVINGNESIKVLVELVK